MPEIKSFVYAKDLVEFIERTDPPELVVRGKSYKKERIGTWRKLECGGYECTECGEVVDTMTKYCPECGSDKTWRKE